MEPKAKRLILSTLYLSLAIGAMILCFNSSGKLTALLLYGVFAVFLLLHHRFFGQELLGKGKIWLFPFVALAMVIQLFDHTSFIGFYFIILIAYTVFGYEFRFSLPFAVFAVACHILVLLYLTSLTPSVDLLSQFSTFIIPRSMVILFMAVTRYSLIIGMENKLLTDSLQEKSDALSSALAQLSAYASELEETADLQAREKLMKELHDKLGHLLATASIGTQAAVVMLDKDVVEAKKRLEMVIQQIQEAMQSLREVISGSTLNSTEQELRFLESLIRLLSETEKRTGIPVSHNLFDKREEDYEKLPAPQRSFLYNALMEGLTNGIRHGAATRFVYSLTESENELCFLLQDNGKGFHDIKPGYGLSKMLGDAQRFGGALYIRNENGCTLEIRLPFENSAAWEENRNE